MGPAGILDDKWPRPFPYPDAWLNSLHDWYDAQYPAPSGYIKLHGEIARVRITLFGIMAVCLIMVIAGVDHIAGRSMKSA